MNQAFWYVDDIPTKGMWIDMDAVDGTDEVLEQLVERKYCTEDYDCDLLVADAEGLAKAFLSQYDTFDFDQFVECRDHRADDDAKIAYMTNMNEWDGNQFDESFIGKYESNEDFAEQFADEVGLLSEVPEFLKQHFDYESYARDLMQDYWEVDGFYFRSI